MAEPNEMARKILDRQAKTFRQAGDALIENTLGRYAKETLEAGLPISRAGLADWLAAGLAQTPSAKGKIAPELDSAKQLLEGALRFLESTPDEGNPIK